ALEAATGGERLALLEADLQGACQVVVDIRSRFLFESRLFARRRASTLPVRELSELMAEAQVEGYGAGLHARARRPPPLQWGRPSPPSRGRPSTTGPTRSGCCSGWASTPPGRPSRATSG